MRKNTDSDGNLSLTEKSDLFEWVHDVNDFGRAEKYVLGYARHPISLCPLTRTPPDASRLPVLPSVLDGWTLVKHTSKQPRHAHTHTPSKVISRTHPFDED